MADSSRLVRLLARPPSGQHSADDHCFTPTGICDPCLPGSSSSRRYPRRAGPWRQYDHVWAQFIHEVHDWDHRGMCVDSTAAMTSRESERTGAAIEFRPDANSSSAVPLRPRDVLQLRPQRVLACDGVWGAPAELHLAEDSSAAPVRGGSRVGACRVPCSTGAAATLVLGRGRSAADPGDDLADDLRAKPSGRQACDRDREPGGLVIPLGGAVRAPAGSYCSAPTFPGR